jgi:hypothetical protein
MSNKDQASYESVFVYFRDKLGLWPAEVMLDFEKATSNALEKVYLGIFVRGCWFHLCQSLRRRASEDSNVMQMIYLKQAAGICTRMFMCLALLPIELVPQGFKVGFKIYKISTSLFIRILLGNQRISSTSQNGQSIRHLQQIFQASVDVSNFGLECI